MSGGGSIDEITGNQGQMKQTLAVGLETLDLNQTVTFTLYRRVVLPADGFVFWVRDAILSPSALPGTTPVNRVTPNQARLITSPAPELQARGSLHHTTINRQDPDESFSNHRMVFTSVDPVDDLAAIAPDTMYLALTDGQRYAFSTRSGWYQQAGLYHYSGDAVYPTLATQIIEDPGQLNLTDQVVSNSLPIWLGLNQLFPVYPSFLVPDNIHPPYAVINIDDNDTSPLQAGATKDAQGSRWQLVKDTVKVVTYGVRNDTIMDWLDLVNDYTLDNPDVMGVMNSPVPGDGKRGQVEISALAQKKVINFEVSYYQARMRSLARQIIRRAFIEQFIVPSFEVIA